MDLVKAYNYFSEKRIKLIKAVAECEEDVRGYEKRIKKLKKEKNREYDIEVAQSLMGHFTELCNTYREKLDRCFEAAESIKAIIALKNHLKTKGCDLYWELEGILSPMLKEWVYGKE